MAQKDLIPQNKRTKEEQKRIAVMGGKASVKARRLKRDLKERLTLALETIEKEAANKKLVRELMGEDEATNLDVIVAKLVANAKKGDIQSINQLLDRLYGKPTQPTDITTGGQPLINIEVQSERGKAEIEKIVK